MTEIILAEWRSAPRSDTCVSVIPDGCRDLIMHVAPGAAPYWFVSSLDARTYTVSIGAGAFMKGFRLRPGARINEERLLASVQRRHCRDEEIRDRISGFTCLPPRVAGALDCLASGVGSINEAAARLGVSRRSLQRLLKRETGPPPAFWLMLARVRRAARTVSEQLPLAEIAALHGYADQAHMSRDFRRWLNVSPSELRSGSSILTQLSQPGYG